MILSLTSIASSPHSSEAAGASDRLRSRSRSGSLITDAWTLDDALHARDFRLADGWWTFPGLSGADHAAYGGKKPL